MSPSEDKLARLLWKKGDSQKAYDAFKSGIMRIRKDPWFFNVSVIHALQMAAQMAKSDKAVALKIHDLLLVPFSVNILDDFRLNILLEISAMIDSKHGAATVRMFEPNIPWNEKFLRYRLRCYEEMLDPMAGQARKDLNAFLKNAPLPFNKTLSPVSANPQEEKGRRGRL